MGDASDAFTEKHDGLRETFHAKLGAIEELSQRSKERITALESMKADVAATKATSQNLPNELNELRDAVKEFRYAQQEEKQALATEMAHMKSAVKQAQEALKGPDEIQMKKMRNAEDEISRLWERMRGVDDEVARQRHRLQHCTSDTLNPNFITHLSQGI